MTRKLILESPGTVTPPNAAAGEVTYRLYENVGSTPEIYIDGGQGVHVVNTIVKVNCFTRGAAIPAMQPGQIEERQVVCRLVMGTDTFLSFADWLQGVAAQIRSQAPGLPPSTNGRVA
jgi:hypothetical protein